MNWTWEYVAVALLLGILHKECIHVFLLLCQGIGMLVLVGFCGAALVARMGIERALTRTVIRHCKNHPWMKKLAPYQPWIDMARQAWSAFSVP
jgi:hypothetical protein